MSEHFNRLTPAAAEALALLAEECGEVIQMIGKSLRHGLHSCHPGGGESNRVMLGQEIGDVIAAVEILISLDAIARAEVDQAVESKLLRVQRYLHHANTAPALAALRSPTPDKGEPK